MFLTNSKASEEGGERESGLGVDFVFSKFVVVAGAIPSFVLPSDFGNFLDVVVVVGYA